MFKPTLGIYAIAFSIIMIMACADIKEERSASTSFISPEGHHPGRLKTNTRVCYFSDVDSVIKQMDIELEPADDRENKVVNDIMKYTGLPSNFSIYRGNIDNAMATMAGNQRFIIYNKELLRIIDKLSDDYWSSVFILAHEIGHHLAFNISDTLHCMKAELDADAFAADVLYKMGADSNQVTSAIRSSYISNQEDTKTHPSKNKRLAAIRESWLNAAKQRYNSAIPPPPHDQQKQYSFTKEQLWFIQTPDFEPFEPEYPEETPIVESRNIHAVILHVDHPDFETRQPKSLCRKIKLTLWITGCDQESENKSHFLPQTKETMEVWYCEGSVMSVVEEFDRFFTAGRRIKFGSMMLCEHDGCLLRLSEAQTLP